MHEVTPLDAGTGHEFRPGISFRHFDDAHLTNLAFDSVQQQTRGRVYQGVWGSAPLQSLYQPAAGTLLSLPLMPEWYLLIALLGVLSALSLGWAPRTPEERGDDGPGPEEPGGTSGGAQPPPDEDMNHRRER